MNVGRLKHQERLVDEVSKSEDVPAAIERSCETVATQHRSCDLARVDGGRGRGQCCASETHIPIAPQIVIHAVCEEDRRIVALTVLLATLRPC